METEWRLKREELRERLKEDVQLSNRKLSKALGYSEAWVRKWRRRLGQADAEDETAVNSQSRRPKHIARQVSAQTEERILELRRQLSEQYHRRAGARTIAAYLQQQRATGIEVVSNTTIWRILRRHQVILPETTFPKRPFERPEPGEHWEIDFCTAVQASSEAPDKRQNGLEVFNVIDRGSSANMGSESSVQFDAEQALLSMATLLSREGVPRCITYDRDPRFVGSASTRDFPSAFTRFLLCLGCQVDILPPHTPEDKPFVERFQRTLKEECLTKHHPENAAEANAHLQRYRHWYNHERPHQGRDLHGQPPHVLLARASRRPSLPDVVDPDAWLAHFHQKSYKRHVDSRGAIQLWKTTYYVGRRFRNQTVLVRLDAHLRVLKLEIQNALIKVIPIKGLVGHPLEYLVFLGLMVDQARSEWKEYLWRQRRNLSG